MVEKELIGWFCDIYMYMCVESLPPLVPISPADVNNQAFMEEEKVKENSVTAVDGFEDNAEEDDERIKKNVSALNEGVKEEGNAWNSDENQISSGAET
jgi:hypothetical protein